MRKWNSVDEMLPKIDGMVIVYDEQGWIWFARLNEYEKWECVSGGEPGIKVTHWMWPPYPPKKKKIKTASSDKRNHQPGS